jgi:tetratricopeptide (TPR) repeat protein
MCRGHAYNQQDKRDSAIADYSEAIKIDPKDADFFLFGGLVYRSKGLYDRAVADFDEPIRLDPSFGAAHDHRAETVALMNKLVEAG